MASRCIVKVQFWTPPPLPPHTHLSLSLPLSLSLCLSLSSLSLPLQCSSLRVQPIIMAHILLKYVSIKPPGPYCLVALVSILSHITLELIFFTRKRKQSIPWSVINDRKGFTSSISHWQKSQHIPYNLAFFTCGPVVDEFKALPPLSHFLLKNDQKSCSNFSFWHHNVTLNHKSCNLEYTTFVHLWRVFVSL